MTLGRKDFTVTRADGGAHVFRLAGFLRDNDLIGHDGVRGRDRFDRNRNKERIVNVAGSQAARVASRRQEASRPWSGHTHCSPKGFATPPLAMPSVPSSSFSIMDEKPTTSAARMRRGGVWPFWTARSAQALDVARKQSSKVGCYHPTP